jgi:hypothetical protein
MYTTASQGIVAHWSFLHNGLSSWSICTALTNMVHIKDWYFRCYFALHQSISTASHLITNFKELGSTVLYKLTTDSLETQYDVLYIFVHAWYFMTGLLRRSSLSVDYLNRLLCRHHHVCVIFYVTFYQTYCLYYISLFLYLLTRNGLEQLL